MYKNLIFTSLLTLVILLTLPITALGQFTELTIPVQGNTWTMISLPLQLEEPLSDHLIIDGCQIKWIAEYNVNTQVWSVFIVEPTNDLETIRNTLSQSGKGFFIYNTVPSCSITFKGEAIEFSIELAEGWNLIAGGVKFSSDCVLHDDIWYDYDYNQDGEYKQSNLQTLIDTAELQASKAYWIYVYEACTLSSEFQSLEEETCTDSDDGKDYYTYGYINYNYGRTTSYDFCIDDDTLSEMYCDASGNLETEIYVCPYGCSDGACREETCSDGTPYGECSATKPRYCDNGELIDKCSFCGCPEGYECQDDERCTIKEVEEPTRIRWTVEYTADALPEYSDPTWSGGVGDPEIAHEEISNGILYTKTKIIGTFVYYSINDPNLDNSRGATLEARLKLESGYGLLRIDSEYEATSVVQALLRIDRSRIWLIVDTGGRYGEVTGSSYSMDTTNYHKYRMTLKGDVVKVYVDDTLVLAEKTSLVKTGESSIDWGAFPPPDRGDERSEIYWDYVRYSNEGAYPEEETCLDGTPYGECSETKPKYCDNRGVLYDNYCYGHDQVVGNEDDCGCPTGLQCQTDGSCISNIGNTQINPFSGSQGTIFTITSQISDIFGISGNPIAYIQKPDETNIAIVTLYDDGSHGDGAANDGTYGNTWDSTGTVVGTYYIDIVANDALGYFAEDENGASFDIILTNCVSVIDNGDPASKLDVVFVPDCSYDDLSIFASDVNRHIDQAGTIEYGILSIEPFKSNAGKFNFYRVDQLGCDVKCGWGYYDEDWNLIPGRLQEHCHNPAVELASQCPSADKIIVMVKVGFSGFGWDDVVVTRECDGTETYVPEEYYNYNFPPCYISEKYPYNDPLMTVHEFAHMLGLGDEYELKRTIYRYSPPNEVPPNCDVAGCPDWCEGDPIPPYPNPCGVYTTQTECEADPHEYGCVWSFEVDPYFGTQCVEYYNDIDIGTDCLEGVGCYHGCFGADEWRPSNNCMMRHPEHADRFCPVCTRHLNEYLSQYD